MKKWNVNQKPPLAECPKHYCFCWTPPGGTADLSGKAYDSFEEAVNSKTRVTFLHGGCAAPFGKCIRETCSGTDRDCYEPHNSVLKENGLPELFFCDPENLDIEDQKEYNAMARLIWRENA